MMPETSPHSSPFLRQFKVHSTGLELYWEDGLRSRVSFWWLRDHDPQFRHQNGQKLTTTLDWPEQLVPDQVMKEQNCLKVVWAGDQHASLIDEAMLRNHATGENSKSGKIIWNRMLQPEMCFFSWEAVKTDPRARLEWLETVRDYGFAGLNGVGQDKAGLEEVMALIGPIRETNFGRIFDVMAKKNPSNLSDTHYSLPPRTENPYRDPPPGLHVLSCLQPAAKGGETILVDGAFILQKVRKRNPLGYQMLSEVPVKFQYQDDDVWLENKRCLLEFHPDGSLRSLAFNNRSVDPFSLPSAQQESWFKAYRSLERELLASQNQLRVQLQPGQLLLIDNRRVLHGQSTFSAYSNRHLIGCYLEHDGLCSEIRMLQHSPGVLT